MFLSKSYSIYGARIAFMLFDEIDGNIAYFFFCGFTLLPSDEFPFAGDVKLYGSK